jgi:NADH-quinone oxidoreductase subunit A
MLWPFVLYFVFVLILAGGILGLSYILGNRHKGWNTDEPYEGGIIPTGSARIRFDIRFYLNAMFFVVLDLEAMFIFAWAVAFREVGWAGYIEVIIFIAVLVASLVYLARVGALDWGPLRGARRRENKSQDGEIQNSPEDLTKLN